MAMITLAHLVRNLPILRADLLPSAVLNTEIASVTADSRQVVPGSLFVAVPGEKTDGRLFIVDAIARGCAAVVIEGRPEADTYQVPLIFTENSHVAISELAAS